MGLHPKLGARRLQETLFRLAWWILVPLEAEKLFRFPHLWGDK